MSIVAICPACQTENPGSLLLCQKCQASLIGVPRQEGASGPEADAPSLPQQPPVSEVPPIPTADEISAAQVFHTHDAMLKQIRSWAMWSLGLGAVHLFTSGFLSAPWGILLILVGLASFFFQSSSMFVIYAATLSWAALSNLTSFQIGWAAFALYQFYLVYQIIKQYRFFSVTEQEYHRIVTTAPSKTKHAPRFFPWFASLFGCSSILGFALVIGAVIVMVIGSGNSAEIPDYFGFLEGLTVNFGILGVALGLASLLSKYNRKALAILGLAGGALTVVLELVLSNLP